MRHVVKSGDRNPMSAGAWMHGLAAPALAEPAVARVAGRLPHRLVLVADGEEIPVVEHAGAPATVSAHAPADVWREMLAPLPPPGRQSVGAALRAGCGFELRGEPLAVAQTLPLLEQLVEAMRNVASGTMPSDANGAESALTAADDAPPVALDRIESRYLRIDWPEGDHCWIFEEAAGDPAEPVMLLLHTAGADSRQWHALMTDPELGRHWRLVAFDMPCHGRSRPPAGWRGEPWQLDTERYLACIRAWMRAAGHRRVAVSGCSMGAAIGLAFLARHPELAIGGILLETPFRSPGRRTPMLDHPAVHGGRFGAAWVQALLSPHSPASERRFATWISSQAGPGVYEGDLGFYSDEFDAADHVGAIDTARTPLWLMTGDYDYSASPADSKRVADAVPGARFTEMTGLGHFPMTENPARLLSYFRPAAIALRDAT